MYSYSGCFYLLHVCYPKEILSFNKKKHRLTILYSDNKSLNHHSIDIFYRLSIIHVFSKQFRFFKFKKKTGNLAN